MDILRQKLGADIVNYCILPFLMISKEKVKTNFKRVLRCINFVADNTNNLFRPPNIVIYRRRILNRTGRWY